MKSGLYICPGAPATWKAAVRAIWLARPGTRVSKVSSGLSRLREGCTLLARIWGPLPVGAPAVGAARGPLSGDAEAPLPFPLPANLGASAGGFAAAPEDTGNAPS